MRRPLVMALRGLAIVALVTAAGAAFAPPSPAHSPYLSALSDLAATPALAAKKGQCNSFCEFVAPAYTCLHEGSGTRCGTSSTGCVTISC
jgi:hypothetical protein